MVSMGSAPKKLHSPSPSFDCELSRMKGKRLDPKQRIKHSSGGASKISLTFTLLI
jgi:hypothetical protein